MPAFNAKSRREEAARRARRRAPPIGRWRAPRAQTLPDQRAELLLGALVCAVLLFVVAADRVRLRARRGRRSPTTASRWFGPRRQPRPPDPGRSSPRRTCSREPVYTFHAWPIIWGTLLITGGAVALSFVSALFVAVFVVEFAPELDPPHPRAGRAPAGERAVGDLRPARRARPRAVHRQPLHHRRAAAARSPTSSR